MQLNNPENDCNIKHLMSAASYVRSEVWLRPSLQRPQHLAASRCPTYLGDRIASRPCKSRPGFEDAPLLLFMEGFGGGNQLAMLTLHGFLPFDFSTRAGAIRDRALRSQERRLKAVLITDVE